MKRKIIAGIVTVALGALMVPAAFAAIGSNQPDNAANTVSNATNQQFFNQMFDQHKTWLDKAVKDGQITEDQAKTWNQHFEQMKDFHSKNGMGPMMNGAMMNMMSNGGMMNMMGNGTGMGPGMMGNFYAPASK